MARALKFMLLVLALALSTVAFAQDATEVPVVEEPMAQQPAGEDGMIGVGDITGDSAAYHGQTVTVEGNVVELVNIRSFTLGDGGSEILVLNNSGQEFNIGLTRDARVQVTGTIYPSANEGGWDQFAGEMSAGMAGEGDAEATPAPEGEATSDMGQTGGGVGLDQYPTVLFADRFPDHTIMVIQSVEDIVFVETEG